MLERLLSLIACLQNPFVKDIVFTKYLDLLLFEHWDVSGRVQLLVAVIEILLG